MKTIICTTGTSIAKGKQLAAAGSADDHKAYRETIVQNIEKFRTEDPSVFLKTVCAETNSLQSLNCETGDEVVLLHTETTDGQVCSEIIAKLIADEFGAKVKLKSIKGLQVADAVKFRREGVQNLFAELDALCAPATYQDEKPILNSTGGFKAVVPYLTLYGLLKHVPVYYIFERSDSLITLPPVPINFDFKRLANSRDALLKLCEEGVLREDEFFDLIPGVNHWEREFYSSLLERDDDHMVSPSAFAMLAIDEIDLQKQKAEVLLSVQAEESLKKSDGNQKSNFEYILQRLPDRTWRDSKVHPVNSTDLLPIKTGNTNERALIKLVGQRIYVCELALHDKYERLITTRKWGDYKDNEFIQWFAKEQNTVPESDSELFDHLRKDTDDALQLLEKSETQMAKTKAELKEARAEFINKIDKKERELNKKLRNQREEMLASQQAMEQELIQLRRPWWKKIFSRV